MGKLRGKDLITPRTDLYSDHCVRFHYHGRGRYIQGFSVDEYELSRGHWETRWETPFPGNGPDMWLMGQFDLGPGHYDILFRPHQAAIWSLDDIYVVEGTCEAMECFPGEFMCNTHGTKNCLPIAVKCNIAVDCDDAEDEKNCNDANYVCDFSNGNICNIKQHTDDFMRGEWEFVNSTETPEQMTDHTTGLASGTMLHLDTTRMLSPDQVKASMDVYLRNTELCLSFYYFSGSPYTFEMTLDVPSQSKVTLVHFTDRQTQSWTNTQATLPAATSNTTATLTITVSGGESGTHQTSEVILLDDITISLGQCPEFVCPGDMLKCEDEAFCVPRAQVCNNFADCAKSTDENFCTCGQDEYKCPNGPCIGLNKTCDNIQDCQDNSDEGEICDSKRNVTCDFELSFQCGYSVIPNASSYHWARVQGRTAEPGPAYDHTFMDHETQMGFYFLALSQKAGVSTSLASPPFSSTGTGLVFYYHIRHFLHDLFNTGRLSVVVTDLSKGNETKLWEITPDNEDLWREKCVDLPAGELKVTFIAYRGEAYSANIGLDDVMLLDTSCDVYHTGAQMIGRPFTLTAADSTTDTTPAPSCASEEYMCRNGLCITSDQVCDGVDDCPDGYDELTCDSQ
ncbi:MAM and LDL-receptor class A domain-containing protein [Elysia marginata]|uniref:MAM and LDL-receptor class A domain-containing protein n=1 Tax=Elysia marginata TaxID=1093978 RepID=A0AAV4J626_9GAST|nr:MAM and LDL-receptor class A domain-containing protein [Elysia marginata]